MNKLDDGDALGRLPGVELGADVAARGAAEVGVGGWFGRWGAAVAAGWDRPKFTPSGPRTTPTMSDRWPRSAVNVRATKTASKTGHCHGDLGPPVRSLPT